MKKKLIFILCIAGLTACQSPSERIKEEFDRIDRSIGDSIKPAVLTGGTDLFMLTRQMNSLDQYIDSLKEILKAYSLSKFPEKKGEEELLDTETPEQLMLSEKRADSLYDKLKNFEDAASAAYGPVKEKENPNGFPYLQLQSNKQEFRKMYFTGMPTVAALTMLSAFQLRIRKDFDAVFKNHIKK